MKLSLRCGAIALCIVSSAIALCIVLMVFAACNQKIDKSKNPPAMLQESDLVGTWKANYGRYHGVDTLILRADGTFKQIYKNQRENYVYETPWNKWSLERFPDGRVRMHLEGGRYYVEGIWEGETEGLTGGEPWPFHDPFDPERRYKSVHMVRQLILNVRLLPSGELVLAHMWPSSESPLGDVDVFHLVETPPPPETPTP